MHHRPLTPWWSLSLVGIVLGLLCLPAPVSAAKKCLDCHTKEKKLFSGYKFKHAPATGDDCETCHKRHGFAQTLILQDNTSELCYSCHEDLRDKYAVGNVHFPVAEGACWDCHDPHGSAKPMFLRAGTEDANDPQSCLICHKNDISESLHAEYAHQPFEVLNCVGCHDPHNSPVAGLLVREATALCGECHQADDKKMVSAHKDRHAEMLQCTDCHSGHSSSRKALLSENTHAPFADGDCEICHSLPAADGSVTFADGVSPSAICGDCHDDQVAASSAAHSHAAVEADNCVDCHDPHSSRFAGLLKSDERELCAGCHDDIVSGKGLTPHLPAVLGQCSSCHDVHGSDQPQLVKSRDASLCLGCHAEYVAGRDSATSVHAAADECITCHSPHEGQTAAILRNDATTLCADCHGPDQAALSAASGHQPYMTGNCVGCHDPHFSSQQHLVKETGLNLCVGCHTDIDRLTKLPVEHPPATDDCQTCHQPHYSSNDQLLVSNQRELCESCHDADDLHLNQEFVHTPARIGDCSGCHNPHGAQQEKLVSGRITKINVNGRMVGQLPRLTGKTSDLCYTCHEDLSEAFRKQGVHKPVADGACDACHAPHGSDQFGFLKAGTPDVCITCHTLEPTLADTHGGFDLTTADCLSCHNPHVSDNPALVRTLQHPPFEDRAGCDACHDKGPNGEPTLVSGQAELCGMCHDEINPETGMKHQHAPFAMEECSSCHGVHASDNPGLLKADGSQLCFSCHAEVKKQTTLAVNHKPFGEGECLSCHRPHASQNVGLLNKPPTTFCVSCHDDLGEQLKNGAPHAPVVDGDCSACHEPHAGPQKALLTATKQDLCGTCHDLTAPTLSRAHSGFDVAAANCQNCHAAHAGPKGTRGLLLPDRHAPFVAGECNTCHPANTPALASTVRSLCLDCHDLTADLSRAVVHQPVASDSGCVGCHGPHVGFGKALQVNDGVETCLGCHDDTEFTGAMQHEPAFDDCATCHQPHSADYKSLLDSPDIQELCLGCHDGALESHYHPMGEGVINPLTKQTLTCVGCHSPHSSEFQALLVADRDRRLCVICHDVAH